MATCYIFLEDVDHLVRAGINYKDYLDTHMFGWLDCMMKGKDIIAP